MLITCCNMLIKYKRNIKYLYLKYLYSNFCNITKNIIKNPFELIQLDI